MKRKTLNNIETQANQNKKLVNKQNKKLGPQDETKGKNQKDSASQQNHERQNQAMQNRQKKVENNGKRQTLGQIKLEQEVISYNGNVGSPKKERRLKQPQTKNKSKSLMTKDLKPVFPNIPNSNNFANPLPPPPPPPPKSFLKQQNPINNVPLPPPMPTSLAPPPPPRQQFCMQTGENIVPPPPPLNLPNFACKPVQNTNPLPPPLPPQVGLQVPCHKQYPINLKKDEINQSQKDRIRNMKITVQNSEKIKQDGTIPIKLVLVGDGSVGKTSMLISYTTDNFPTDYVPTIFDNYVADVKIGDKKIKLWLWDTAGQQQYQQLRLISYQKADIFLVCFSMIDHNSFQNALSKWFPQVHEESPKAIKIIVGTKSDLHNQYLLDPKNTSKAIPLDYIKKKCESKKCLFLPCSGMNQKGLSQVFNKAMGMVIDRMDRKKKEQSSLCQVI